MDLDVEGKLIIVLGGSRGMGFEAARILAAEGAKLALISRHLPDSMAAAEHLAGQHGNEAIGLGADASIPDEFEIALKQSVDRLGAPAGLLITAGLTDQNGTLLEASDADWEVNFQNVLMSHVRACRAVLRYMITAGGGAIVTTAAYSARIPKPFLFPYAAQKAAVVNLTRNIAKSFGGQGVRANCVCPGVFDTGVVSQLIDAAMNERNITRVAASAWLIEQQFGMSVAMRRPGLAAEAGELMAFLLSGRAAYLNGAIINIDGGSDF